MSKTPGYLIRYRERHHAALEALANELNQANRLSGLQIWRKLRRIEARAARCALAQCNGEQPDRTEEECNAEEEGYLDQVAVVFGGSRPPGLFFNGDPRGYTLKLGPGSVPYPLHTDWGSYQILAPVID